MQRGWAPSGCEPEDHRFESGPRDQQIRRPDTFTVSGLSCLSSPPLAHVCFLRVWCFPSGKQ